MGWFFAERFKSCAAYPHCWAIADDPTTTERSLGPRSTVLKLATRAERAAPHGVVSDRHSVAQLDPTATQYALATAGVIRAVSFATHAVEATDLV